MKTKRLITSTLLYGIGDLLVVAVGGFLLIPMYTRTLSQEEYGIFSILRTNTDLLIYVIHFGLISAVSRLYFDYKRDEKQYEYLSSVLILFVIGLVIYGIFFAIFGKWIWSFLSPNVPFFPYLFYCLCIAILTFFSSFVLIWLRIENKVTTFVGLQALIAFLMLVFVSYVLVVRDGSLGELLWALAANSLLAALALPLLLSRKLTFTLSSDHVFKTLRFALPITIGYFAYFLINRGSMVVLQRYVSVEQVAIFGLSQQIAVIVILASGALAKTLQPVIYGATPEDFPATVENAGKLYFLMMAGLSGLIVLFSPEVLAIAAPEKYASGYYIFVSLILVNFIYSLSFVSNSVLLYFKLSAKSVLISVFGGLSSLAFNLLLVPEYELYGASISMLISAFIVLFFGFYLTRNLLKNLNLKYVFLSIPFTFFVTSIAISLRYYQVDIFWAVFIKVIFSAALSYILYHLFKQKALIKG